MGLGGVGIIAKPLSVVKLGAGIIRWSGAPGKTLTTAGQTFTGLGAGLAAAAAGAGFEAPSAF